ncbi:ABC transporter substrate-binding protein [Roseibium aggregatum]|uniref:Extracellular solute-binding protein n=1 Tax=Roseibium aggregatum TaxID=187304 RepID=A0A939EJ08_9HYPH|nr:extracellular solute-binding protein [Roseibium aggregatum]MBN9673863.1 extracellular solute-binding protein [Roseibium aggregatum]
MNESGPVLSNEPISAPAVKRRRPALRVLGTSVTQLSAIKAAAEEDLGLDLELITLDGTEAQRRGALHPESFDVYDQWFHDIDLIWPTGSIQYIDINRIHRWDEINALPKTGRLKPEFPRARGGDPAKRLFVQLDGSLGDMASDRVSMVPTVHNADSFAVVGADAGEVDSWAALLDPAWAGRVVLQADAAIGSLDMLLALEASGELHAGDLGDLTLEEIDSLIEKLRGYRDRGHFRRFWSDEDEAVDAMMQDGPIIGSLWWSGVTRLRSMGKEVTMVTPREGYRGWFGGLALSVHVDKWLKDAAYDYLNWWLEGRPGAIMARSGAYMANPDAVRPYLDEAEWDFWYEGKPAGDDIRGQDGSILYARGSVREGGSYQQRMSRVTVWDTVMNEHNYLVRRWEHSLEGQG